nr:serine/threonine-protein kinase [Kitasatospora azatica]
MQPLDPTDPTTVGPYRLLARLGAGGMGLVYLARSAGGRTAAVKVVRPELAADQEFRRRFGREVAAARAVGGAFTAPVVDADPDGPVPWLATAYVLGPSLTQAVSTHGPLPAPSVRALGAGLARALVAVHGAGLVHRDLKPSNVLLATDGPRVIDFGIARALDDERLTGTGLVVGSAGFMSPEQAAGSPTGPASDVFSLGAVLVYAATGAGPFSGAGDSSAAAQLYRVIHDEPSLDALPEELWPVVAACLAKDPADRLTPAELVELLGGGPDAFTGWLPSPVASEIAGHAAAVLDLEVPDRGSVPATGGGAVAGGPAAEQPRPATAPTPTEVVDTNPLTVPTAKGPSRRLLLTGGGAVLLAALGGAAWALTGTDKPGPKPVPPQQPTARPTAPSPAPRPPAPGPRARPPTPTGATACRSPARCTPAPCAPATWSTWAATASTHWAERTARCAGAIRTRRPATSAWLPAPSPTPSASCSTWTRPAARCSGATVRSPEPTPGRCWSRRTCWRPTSARSTPCAAS